VRCEVLGRFRPRPLLAFRLGPARTKLPLTTTLVAGTQADTPASNKLLVMRISNLCKTQEKPPRDEDDEDDDDSSSSGDEGDDEPELFVHRIPHHGAVNRVRVMPQV
jgi:ribosome assembly protein RRB1